MGYLSRLAEIARAQDNLIYHALTLTKAFSILKSDALRLPLSETNSSEASLQPAKMYYMSMARVPSSGYITDRSPGLRSINEAGLLVFDKNILQQHRSVSFRPRNYWGALSPSGRHMGSAREAEERLFSDDPLIRGVRRAIVELRIMVYDEPYTNDSISKQLLILAKSKGIPVKLFTQQNSQGFMHGIERPEDRKRAFNKLKIIPSPNLKGRYQSDARRAKSITKRFPQWGAGSRHWRQLTEYVHKNSYEALSSGAKSSLYYHLRSWDGQNEFMKAYEAEIHNLRSGSVIEQDLFNRLLKQTKQKSVRSFFDFLLDKWKKLYIEYEAKK